MTTAEILTILVGLLVGGDILATFALKARVTSIQTDLKAAMLTQAQHATSIAVMADQISTLRAELHATRIWREDITGFLQTQGFKKRDG